MSPKKPPPRLPLSRERIIQAAVRLADEVGLDALTMRRLGSELGVEAMSLYKHVANKDAILDGVVDAVIGEIELPEIDAEWRSAMRRRAASAREVLTRHSWAIGLMESRAATGPATMRYMNAIIGNLRTAGFSIENAAHAFWLLDSFVYGHVIQEVSFEQRGARPSGRRHRHGRLPVRPRDASERGVNRVQPRVRIRDRPRAHPRGALASQELRKRRSTSGISSMLTERSPYD